MSLKEQLNQDLKEAMRSGDAVRKNVIRLLRGEIRNTEIEVGRTLSDEEMLAVAARQAKQRRDSIEQFRQGNRMDLVAEEEKELAIIETYLPRQLSDEEITSHAKSVIAELGVTDMKGMGQVMGRLTTALKGRADGKRISQIVRSLLSN